MENRDVAYVMEKAYKKAERKLYLALDEIKYLTATKAVYAFKKYVRGHSMSEAPVFIVGPGHSGTSLLLAIVGTHSHIFAVPYESSLAFKPKAEQRKLLKRFRKMAVANGKKRWVEKTPRHIDKIGSILESFPDARILIIMRDGRDVACSYKARRGTRIDKHAEHWAAAVEKVKAHEKSDRIHVLKYESLIADFSGTMSEVMSFLGEVYEPGQAEYYKEPVTRFWHKVKKPKSVSGSNHLQYRNWQVNQPLFDGRGRWHEEMNEQEKEIFKREAGDHLVAFGYEDDRNW